MKPSTLAAIPAPEWTIVTSCRSALPGLSTRSLSSLGRRSYQPRISELLQKRSPEHTTDDTSSLPALIVRANESAHMRLGPSPHLLCLKRLSAAKRDQAWQSP